MALTQFSHVNVWTADVAGMTKWYEQVLGLKKGWRPNFSVDGAWLYLGELPLVHLVEVDATSPNVGRIEHFAFDATDLEGFRATLAKHEIVAEEIAVPGTNLLQLNIHDPDGNHVHIDFRV